RRRPRLHRFLQRLLRQEHLWPLPLQSQRKRQAALHPVPIERLQLVRGQRGGNRLSLLNVADRGVREVTAWVRYRGALGPFAATLAAAALTLSPVGAGSAAEPQVDYILNCMGCHLADGSGVAGKVPSVRDSLVPLSATAAGRRYLVQVPGSSQSPPPNLELARLLSWMVRNLRAVAVPATFGDVPVEEGGIDRGPRLV